VYVRAFPPPASGQRRKVARLEQRLRLGPWLRNGHELLYLSGDQTMAASYTVNGDAFLVQKPRVWMAKLGATAWDLAPDGKGMLVATPGGSRGSAEAGARRGVPRELLRSSKMSRGVWSACQTALGLSASRRWTNSNVLL